MALQNQAEIMCLSPRWKPFPFPSPPTVCDFMIIGLVPKSVFKNPNFCYSHATHCHRYMRLFINVWFMCADWSSFLFTGIDFKIKTVELQGKKIKLQIWWVIRQRWGSVLIMFEFNLFSFGLVTRQGNICLTNLPEAQKYAPTGNDHPSIGSYHGNPLQLIFFKWND